MTQLPLAWTLLTVSLWTAASSQILVTEPVRVLYPKVGGVEALGCDCVNISCDSVYWFHAVRAQGKATFLGKCNNADRVNYGLNVDRARFRLSKKGSSSFVLRLLNVTAEDAGIYSCVLKDSTKKEEMWKPGTLLLPGVAPPTLPPKTKPPVKPVCTCRKSPSQTGCGSLVLWPLVGLVAGLALAVLCTLYYFSRLPKKCRHHFVKRGK